MNIIVRISKEELDCEGITEEELKKNIIKDLDEARDYPGFTVVIEIE